MKGNIGIEFEMVIYYKKEEQIEWLFDKFKDIWCEIDDDGSLNPDYDLQKRYGHAITAEIKTDVINEPKLFLKMLRRILFSKKNPYSITINEDGGDIRIDFNNTTGTHIHYSSVFVSGINCYNEDDGEYDDNGEIIPYKTRGTRELKYFNEEVCEDLLKWFHSRSKKYPTIQNAYFRSYAKRDVNYWDRYSGINISNAKEHGTIEFRICNLRGIKTKEFINALRFQINLVYKAVLKGYKLSFKNIKRERKKALEKYRGMLNDIKLKEEELLVIMKEEK